MKKLGNKLAKILSVDDENYTVNLQFEDGLKGSVSLKHLFSRPKGRSAEILQGGVFRNGCVGGGALAWPNGFELCPDALSEWLLAQRHSSREAA